MAEKLNGSTPGVGHNQLTDDQYFGFVSQLDGAESDLASALSSCREPRKRIKDIRAAIEAAVGKGGLRAFDRAREDDKRPASERETEDQLYRRMMRWLRKPVGTQGAMFEDEDKDVTARPFTSAELDLIDAQGHQAGLAGERSETCPHNPGDEAYARWMTGWTRGNGDKVMAKIKPRPRGRPRKDQTAQLG